MFIYVYIYMYIYMNICIYIYSYIYIHIYILIYSIHERIEEVRLITISALDLPNSIFLGSPDVSGLRAARYGCSKKRFSTRA
jgi:hypothetical protein